MDTVKIGKFLAELRHEKELTQEQLAERLGTSNKTISRWENGNYMPPVEMLAELSEFYGVSINEIISGKRLGLTEEKKAADDNLKEALSEGMFTLEERKEYFTNKWKREHSTERIARLVTSLVLIFLSFILNKPYLTLAIAVFNSVYSIKIYNDMMAYVERNAFEVKKQPDDKKS